MWCRGQAEDEQADYSRAFCVERVPTKGLPVKIPGAALWRCHTISTRDPRFSPRIRIFMLVLGIALLLLVPLIVRSGYWLRVANNVAIVMILTLGLDFIWGRAGQLSFAQTGFFGIGAYTSALLSLHFGIPFFLTVSVAGMLCVGVAIVIGWPSLRLKTHYFALATFGFSEIVRLTAMNWKAVTRGMDGLTQIPPPAIGSFVISRDQDYYYLLFGLIAVSVICYKRLLCSKYGRAFTAVRQGELAGELVGLNTARIKLFAFGLSAVYAGVAGGFYAHLFSVISPDVFSFESVSIPVLVGLFIGGSGSVPGIMAGSAVVMGLPELARVLGKWYMVFYAAGIIILMVYMPEGIAGKVRGFWTRRAKSVDSPRPWVGEASRLELVAPTWSDGPIGPLLRVECLTKRFGGIVAVDDVSFQVRPREIKAIIGPNGAGKTTVLNLITGVYRPDGGAVYFGNRDLLGQAPHTVANAGILRTFQNTRVWKELSVVENVMVTLHASSATSAAGILFGTRAARAEEKAARERAEQILHLVELWAVRDAPAGSLPCGHLRLLELARCLVANPNLILLDEPAAGLNRREDRMLLDRLETVRGLGTGILVIEHNMNFVMDVSDSVVVMNNGRKIAEGTPKEIRNDPVVIEAYLLGS